MYQINQILQRSIAQANRKISTTLQRLATGMRINSPADDPTGLALSTSLNTQIRALAQAKKNTQDGINMLTVGSDSLKKMESVLQQLKELTEKAANGTYTGAQRQAMQKQANELLKSLYETKNSTQFNNINIFGSTNTTTTTAATTSSYASYAAARYKAAPTSVGSAMNDGSEYESYEVAAYSASNVTYGAPRTAGSGGTDPGAGSSGLILQNKAGTHEITKLTEAEANALGYVVIKSAQDFVNQIAADGTGTAGKTYILMNDIDFSGISGFQGIGSFSGTFDGNGYVIKNLSIDNSSYGGINTALFQNVSTSGIIKNVGLENVDIKGTMSASSDDTGGLVGCLEGQVLNSYVTGTIAGSNNVGGLVGRAYGGSHISNSYSSAYVNGSGDNVGGLVGVNVSNISNSYATGEVSGSANVGGFIGSSGAGSIKNSYSSGNVSGRSSVGGFIGDIYHTNIDQSYSSGNVTKNGGQGGNYGGFIGNANTSIISNSYSLGNVNGSVSTFGATYVGGFVGSSASVDYKNNYSGASILAGGGYSGGFVGDGSFASSGDNTVANSFWNKTSSLSASGTGASSVSGLTGLSASEIKNSSNFTKAGWDSSVWNFSGNSPQLSWQVAAKPDRITEAEATSKGYIMIKNADQFVSLINQSGTNTAGKTYVLMNDIDMSSISNYVSKADFAGTLDGNGYVIKNLSIDNSSQTDVSTGLFANVAQSGIIKNVGVVDVNIKGSSTSSSGPASGTGALVGLLKGKIINSYSTGTVSGKEDLGGLVGYVNAYLSSTIAIENSFSSATVIADDKSGSTSTIVGVGGLVGKFNNGKILSSYATGDVISSNDAFSVGGLVGSTYYATIVDSYATGNVSGTYFGVGGLVGSLGASSSVSGSYALGNVSGRTQVGGLVGSISNNSASITNSYAKGDVTSTLASPSTGNPSNAGGLVGNINLTLSGNNIVSISNSFSTGKVNAKDATTLGGFIGSTNVGSGHTLTLSNNFWNTTTSGVTTGVGNAQASGVTNLTTAQFATSTTFTNAGWSNSVWDFAGSGPNLAWQNASSSSPSTPSTGGITEEEAISKGYILIKSAQDFLDKISADGSGTSGKTYILMNDIDFSGISGFTGMQNFAGTFDGNGHVIKNLTIDNSSSSYDGVSTGLFGSTTKDAVIKNVGVVDANIKGANKSLCNTGILVGDLRGQIINSYSTGTVSAGGGGVGGLAGMIWGGSVSKSSSTATVSGNSSVGGLAGNVFGNISDSYATGNVTAASGYVGGLVGNIYIGSAGSTSSISNSYATGQVNSGSGSYAAYTGGLVGSVSGDNNGSISISNSYSTGLINSISGSGFIGNMGGSVTVSNSFWNTDTSGRSSGVGSGSSAGVTGLTNAQFETSTPFTNAGWDTSDWGFTVNGPHLIWENYTPAPREVHITSAQDFIDKIAADGSNTAGITFILDNDIDFSGITGFTGIQNFAGTFEGNGHVIKNLTIDNGSITGYDNDSGLFVSTTADALIKNVGLINAYVKGKHASGLYAGILVGLLRGRVENSYSTGTVEGPYAAGGLVGAMLDSAASISNSYSSAEVISIGYAGGLAGFVEGTIENSYASGTVTGSNNLGVGGLVGYNKAVIKNSYATTNVIGTDATGLNKKGGLVGSNDGTIENSFWNTQTSGQSSGVGDGVTTGVTGLTSAQFKTSTPFTNAGWSNTVWDFTVDGPHLIWENYTPTQSEFHIKSAQDFIDMLGDGSNTAGKTYILDNDIDFSGITGFTGIQNFAGTFEGNGHVIKNLTANSTTKADLALFNSTTSASTIKNVTIDNFNISAGDWGAAALVGTNKGTISNVKVKNSTINNDYHMVGALVSTNDGGTITDSSAENVTVSGWEDVGALVGDNDRGGIIKNSWASGVVIGNGDGIGGLVGKNVDSTIENSYSSVNVSTKSGLTSVSVGGLVGENNGGTIKDSYASGNVSGTSEVGGLVGYSHGGSIIGSHYKGGIVTASGDNVGGLVGNNKSIIDSSYAAGSVTGGTNVGGLIGTNSGTVSKSYSSGEVQSSLNTGGFIGEMLSGSVSDSYTTSNVTGGSQMARVAGGFIGSYGGGSISNSYASGTLSVHGGYGSDGAFIGEIKSGATLNITGSFWNSSSYSSSSGGIGGSVSSAGLTSLTSAQFSASTPFTNAGWSNTVWNFTTDGPHLIWENYTPTSNEVHITSAQDFIDKIAADGSNTAGKTYILDNDIDFSGISGFIGIKDFAGTFEGNGHVIKNLTINNMSDSTGLFRSTTADAVIKDVGLENVNVSGYLYVGGLVGYNNGTVSNSYVTGSVTGYSQVGGLIGYSSNGSLISDSYFTGTVTGEANVGGLAGNLSGSVERSYSSGQVIGSGKGLRVGGLVGSSWNANISDSYSTSSVSGKSQVGGFIGDATGITISNSYSYGSVSASSSKGGFAGSLGSDSTITNSFWNTTTSGLSNGVGTGSSSGVAGLSTAQFENAQNFISKGWDTSVWDFNYDRPHLKFENYKPSTSGGTGVGQITAEEAERLGYILIWNADDFMNKIAQDGSGTAGKTYILMDNINMSSISNYLGKNNFAGTLDGNGYAIENLSSSNSLFGSTTDTSEIKNLTLDNVRITSASREIGILTGWNYGIISNVKIQNSSISSSSSTVGSFAGVNYGTIKDSSSTADVSASGYIGGLVGENYGTVNNSSFDGVLSAPGDFIGGIVGFNSGSILNSHSGVNISSNSSTNIGGIAGSNTVIGTISGSYSTGSISGYENVGGLVGSNSGKVENSNHSGGTISGQGSNVGGLIGSNLAGGTVINSFSTSNVESFGSNIGGLIGSNAGSVTDSYSSGLVNGTYIRGSNIGGLIGINLSGGSVQNSHSLSNVSSNGTSIGGLIGSNAGSVAGSYSSGSVNGRSYDSRNVGGLIGANTGSVTGSNASGNVSGAKNVGGLIGSSSGSSSFVNNSYYAGGTVIGSSDNVGGLIGYLNGGSLSNSYSSGTVSGQNYVGGLIGYSADTTSISSSHSSANVSGASYVGGFVGYAFVSPITNSYSTGSVTATGNYAGGFAGQLYDSGLVSDSYSSGNVSGKDYVGGFAGSILSSAGGSTIKNSYSTGNVSGNSYLGGFAGSNSGSVSGVHSSGTVNAKSNTSTGVGGLIGLNSGSITSSYSYSNVVFDYTNSSSASLGGGLVGKNSGSITLSYATGSVTGSYNAGGLVGSNDSTGIIDSSYSIGNVSGNAQIGGFVGQNNGTITKSYSTGNATGNGTSSTNIAGFVGSNNGGNISNSYSVGNVYASGILLPPSTGGIGGFVGNFWSGSISNSYSFGNVPSIGGNTGGFAGSVNSGATISNSFWNTDSGSSNGVGSGSSSGLTGLTAAEFANAQNFINAGWDTTIWNLHKDNSRPHLVWENYIAPPQPGVDPGDEGDPDFDGYPDPPGGGGSGGGSYPSDPGNSSSKTEVILQVGTDSSSSSQIKVDTSLDFDAIWINLSNSLNSQKSLESIDKALASVSNKLASFGTTIDILNSVIDTADVRSENLSAAKSTIMDADVAAETVELMKAKKQLELSNSLFTQVANMQYENAMSLIKGLNLNQSKKQTQNSRVSNINEISSGSNLQKTLNEIQSNNDKHQDVLASMQKGGNDQQGVLNSIQDNNIYHQSILDIIQDNNQKNSRVLRMINKYK